ncbi:MAG: hypothetical protein KFB95_05875 [Simkaniaceae bacterium]|nr:MAG: hypothetical protein KFB95_05875 [Simkaniaceae bacterium]
MEATQSTSHGCFWYLFCCCLCDSSEDTTQKRVAQATDPLLRNPETPRYETMGERQVTFESDSGFRSKGILKKAASDSALDRGRDGEYRDLEEQERSPLVHRRDDRPRTPVGSPGSEGSNPNSPAHGYTGTVDYSQWGVGKGTSSPAKKKDDGKDGY